MTVVVEVAGSDHFPVRSRIGPDELAASRDLGPPVHLPDRRLTVRILPQEVGVEVAVEVRLGKRRRVERLSFYACVRICRVRIA